MADRYRREHEDMGRRSEGRGSMMDAGCGGKGPSDEDERDRHMFDSPEGRFARQDDRRSGDGASGERGEYSQSSSGPSPSRTRDGLGAGNADVGGGRPEGRGPSHLRGGGIRPMFGDDGPRQSGTFAGRGPKGYQRSDERIREDTSDRLTETPDVDASDIKVEVSSGEVTLTGTVQDHAQKRRAEEIVEDGSGVSDVINNLRVQKRSDAETDKPTPPSA